jgi:hypothetical protein
MRRGQEGETIWFQEIPGYWLIAYCVASDLWNNAITNFQSTTSWNTSTAIHRRRCKGNQGPGGITGAICSCGIEIRRPDRQVWGRFEPETLNCGHKSRGTRAQQWLRPRGPRTIVSDRLVLSIKRAPDIKPADFSGLEREEERENGRLTVGRNIISTLILSRECELQPRDSRQPVTKWTGNKRTLLGSVNRQRPMNI